MLTKITDLPSNVVGVRATGEVDKKDYEQVLLPALDNLSKKQDKLNYLMELDTDVKNFSLGAWLDDAGAEFSEMFSFAIPGETRGYTLDQLEEAKKWVAS